MARKTFFQDRTPEEIRALNSRNIYSQKNLVKRLVGAPPDRALILRSRLVPGRFFTFSYVKTGADASRAYLKHANLRNKELIRLSQPRTIEEALATLDIPVTIRLRDLEALGKMREEEIKYIGYAFRPITGTDRRLRRLPFYVNFEGGRIRAYEEKQTEGPQIKPYMDVRRADEEGAVFVVRVPSREKKNKRYPTILYNVAIRDFPEKRVAAWGIKTSYGEPEAERRAEEEPPTRTYDFRFTRKGERESSDVFTFIPQDAAAYFSLVNFFARQRNFVPMEMSQFSFPSKFAVEEIWRKLNNNLLVYDPTLTSKDKLRQPHLAEKSLILGRSMAKGNYQPEEILWWDSERDGKISDYQWNYSK
jgi:hypothetical protein